MSNVFGRAQLFAAKAHSGQTYGEEFPYTMHLQAVVSVLVGFGVTNDRTLAGAQLHDVLEDTTTEYEELVALFGQEIADDVAALSEPKGGNRVWRHAQTYPRIRSRGIYSVVLKLADRIANVSAGGKKLGTYCKEHPHFKREIYIMGIDVDPQGGLLEAIRQMQEHLDDLIAKV